MDFWRKGLGLKAKEIPKQYLDNISIFGQVFCSNHSHRTNHNVGLIALDDHSNIA